MISRRNIRIKVLQTLYQAETAGLETPQRDPVKQLQAKYDETTRLFVYLLYFITEVARYAEWDAGKRASKNIVTEEDLNINTKISGNTLLWKILDNTSFQKAVKDFKASFPESGEWVKKIYTLLTDSEKYKKYIAVKDRPYNDEKDILIYIFSELMMLNEEFDAFLEDSFTCWNDDFSMMGPLMLNYLQKPGVYNLMQLSGDEKWNFGKDLLLAAIDKKDYLLEIIKPRLKNWDPERIAVLDMLIMRLGICEFLYFDTIPPKVTINEYIDLAKEYSTPQSGFFVNGILDGIHKDLVKDGKMNKTDFRQQNA